MKYAILFLLTLCGCSSIPNLPETQSDVTLSRIDGATSRPGWLKESEPFQVEDGKVTMIGQATIPADNRVEAAYRIAENNAKVGIAGAIEQRLDTVFQNAEEGTSMDTTQVRYVSAEATKLTATSLRLGKRYWEKVLTFSETGRSVIYKVFVKVSMPEQDFKRAITDALRRQAGKGGLSEDFAKKVQEHWEQFTQAE